MNKSSPELPSALRCYWVLPGQFLAGAYPASRYFENQTQQLLDSLLMLGINTFINLTQTGEMPPYEAFLQQQAGWLDKTVVYRHFPIGDFNCPTPAEMRTILTFIGQSLGERQRIYMHCYAGIGRTGTVAGCFLAERSGSGAAALKHLAGLRRQLPNALIRSPESDEQWNFVKNWKAGN